MDLDNILMGGTTKDYFSRGASMVHEFYLTGPIGPAEDYIAWFDIIRHASEKDHVKIYINSEGGDLFTAIQFSRVLSDSEATIIVSIEGACMSAATIIMLYADVFEISEHTMFMFHNYSGGTIGKGGEMYDNIIYEREWSSKMLASVYADFLTEEEVTNILNNKDIWMGAEEVTLRLNNRSAAHAARRVEENPNGEQYEFDLERDSVEERQVGCGVP